MKYVLYFLLLSSLLSYCKLVDATELNVTLANQCPPSFELRDGRCYLVNLYQLYSSVQGRGVGGTQTALPNVRDGFTPAQIDLGRYLFFDPVLSKDGTVSCASCHQPQQGFADGQAVSTGVGEQQGTRSAPTLWNVGFLERLFWDGRAQSLEQQAMGPLFASNEMANTPQQLEQSLRSNREYQRLFAEAFPSSDNAVNVANVATALTAFQSSLISLNSRYDQYAHGFHDALNEQEVRGLNVFRSFVARCAECHQPPLFTNNQIAVIGVPEKQGVPLDPGAQVPFHAAKLRGGFKVPTLRNITKTAPYMHAGNFETLFEATEFYNKGRGHAVPDNEALQLHWHIWEPNLTRQELTDIVAFLGTLTDESLTPEVPQKVPSGLPVLIKPTTKIIQQPVKGAPHESE